jgi:hypothetical protein
MIGKKVIGAGIRGFLTMLFACLCMFAYAQQDQPGQTAQTEVREDFSDNELQQFADAATEVIKVQMENEKKMVQAIQDEQLDLERFNAIAQAHQSQDQSIDATPEEMTSFNNAAQNIIKIQQDMEAQMEQAVKESGMEVNTFHEIMMAYQSSDKVREKVDVFLKNGNGNQE